ncbi:(d)CMP kinase [Serpentinicella sp. ANB-PHB4]|uniref:(d)CMP kinase n=1 Tax=Serpentinicella sp. ANB-PHB4 TaxID=3074076 RepID=UPI00285CEC33|nr:(d)CMP kinase [Serpentinicella sp. ANB-PHB4]MDR5658146.1 (d)CMP kinase [Serpentinicella sp. ANB-PHB4]
MKHVQIAIDGPAGAGKSTIAKKLALKLEILYIDTGAMYRALTYKVLKNGLSIHDDQSIVEMATTTEINFNGGDICLDGENVSIPVRSQDVTKSVSFIAQIPEVREILVEMQRNIAANNHVVMDGRDIGSNVLPNADFKFFVTATVAERAKRRYLELKTKNTEVTLDQIENDIKLRDKMDSERTASPLIKAEDAITIDTTSKGINEVVELILNSLKLCICHINGGNLIEERA